MFKMNMLQIVPKCKECKRYLESKLMCVNGVYQQVWTCENHKIPYLFIATAKSIEVKSAKYTLSTGPAKVIFFMVGLVLMLMNVSLVSTCIGFFVCVAEIILLSCDNRKKVK